MIALVGPGGIHLACYLLPTVLRQKPLPGPSPSPHVTPSPRRSAGSFTCWAEE